MDLSLISIFIGLALLMFLCFKGHSIIWVAPACAAFVALLSGADMLGMYTGEYMSGLAGYVRTWFPAFFLGAVYGKIMDMTGSARSLADKVVRLIGPKRAVAAVILPSMLMTYGGVSLFVAVFVIYPMGYAIYRAANLPRTLLPGAIAFGSFGITMTTVPGTPQIQNLIPAQFYNTGPMAAPVMSIVACIMIFIPGYIFLTYRAKKAMGEGRGFVEDLKYNDSKLAEADMGATVAKWHWLCGLIPIVMVVAVLNLLKMHIVVALLCGILACCAMNYRQYKVLLPSASSGANGSLVAIMNTACAVGFGSVVSAVPGFAALTAIMMNMPGSILFSQAVVVNLLAGATGSASGGMSIALEALAPQYLERALAAGINPEYLHRIASLSAGGLDTLPHNGAVLTLLAVSNCTHKESYFDIGIAVLLIPTAVSLLLALVWGMII